MNFYKKNSIFGTFRDPWAGRTPHRNEVVFIKFPCLRVLKEQLRSMGGSGPAAVDYESLIDKFVDPKLPDR